MPPRIDNETGVHSILKRGLAYAKAKVEYADLLYERAVRIELQKLPDRLIPKPFNAKARVQLRLLDKGRKAEIKVGTLDLASIRQAVDDGVKLLKATPRPEKPVALAPIPNPGKVRYGVAAPAVFLAAAIFDALTTGIADLAKKTEKKHPGLEVKPEFWFFSQREEKAIADTEGVFKTQVMPRTFLQVFTRVKGRDGRMTQTRARLGQPRPYTEIATRAGGGKLVLAPATRRFVLDWFEKTVGLQDAVTLSAEQARALDHMILHYTTAGVFVHEALGHNFEADIVKAGGSGIIDQQGEARGRVACEDVNIMDGPVAGDFERGFGTEFIDDEGVEVRSKPLAERGAAVGMIHNRETAAYFGKEPNGGAFSEMGDRRIPRMSNTYIMPASKKNWRKDLKALIADVTSGIILVGTTGGAVSKDGMSSSVQLGYLVEGGRITKTVKPANFAAKTLQALRYVDAFAGPMSIDDVGFCGKGQTKFVGDGAPTWTRLKNNEYVGLSVQG
jgi:predicted Zn-dependent protease